MARWRQGTKVKRNVYFGDQPVAMLATEDDAYYLVGNLNFALDAKKALRNILLIARRERKRDWPKDIGDTMKTREAWDHIIRFCTESGLTPDGVLKENNLGIHKHESEDCPCCGYPRCSICYQEFPSGGVMDFNCSCTWKDPRHDPSDVGEVKCRGHKRGKEYPHRDEVK